MNFQNATFSAAFGTSAQLPPSSGPEVSFCGRSNVGKSSLLNKLMSRKGLAKVSAKPGKTATINFYDVDGADFVDLPGYGFAHVSKSEKSRWSELIEGYFAQRRAFALVCVLVDIRHTKVSALDIDMVNFVQGLGVPFLVVLTKADKLSKQGVQKNTAAIRRALALQNLEARTAESCGSHNFNNCAGVLAISSETGANIEKLRDIITRAVDNPEEF